MLRVSPPPPPPPLMLRLAPRGGAPLTQWQTRPQRLRHPSPHCRHGGNTVGPARKRPSPLRLVPSGCRAGTCRGLVGEATGAPTRLGPPPRPCASVHRPADANRRMPYLRVFHLIWVLGRGVGGLPRDGYTTCLCSFSPWAAQKSKFWKLVFLIP